MLYWLQSLTLLLQSLTLLCILCNQKMQSLKIMPSYQGNANNDFHYYQRNAKRFEKIRQSTGVTTSSLPFKTSQFCKSWNISKHNATKLYITLGNILFLNQFNVLNTEGKNKTKKRLRVYLLEIYKLRQSASLTNHCNTVAKSHWWERENVKTYTACKNVVVNFGESINVQLQTVLTYRSTLSSL